MSAITAAAALALHTEPYFIITQCKRISFSSPKNRAVSTVLPVNPRTDNVETAHSEEKCPLRAQIFLISLLSQLQLTVTIMVNQEGAL